MYDQGSENRIIRHKRTAPGPMSVGGQESICDNCVQGRRYVTLGCFILYISCTNYHKLEAHCCPMARGNGLYS